MRRHRLRQPVVNMKLDYLSTYCEWSAVVRVQIYHRHHAHSRWLVPRVKPRAPDIISTSCSWSCRIYDARARQIWNRQENKLHHWIYTIVGVPELIECIACRSCRSADHGNHRAAESASPPPGNWGCGRAAHVCSNGQRNSSRHFPPPRPPPHFKFLSILLSTTLLNNLRILVVIFSRLPTLMTLHWPTVKLIESWQKINGFCTCISLRTTFLANKMLATTYRQQCVWSLPRLKSNSAKSSTS